MSTPAGWYDDPGAPGSGSLRWWDGAVWTEHVAPRPTMAAQPAQPTVAAQPAQPTASGYPAAYPMGLQVAYGKPTATPDGVPLANVWLRLAAKIIDGVITGVLVLLLTAPFIPGLVRAYRDYFDELGTSTQRGSAADPFALYTDPGYYRWYIATIVAALVVSILYTVLFLRMKAGTPGKLMLGMRVRPWERPPQSPSGGLTWGTSWLRWLGEVVPAQLTCGIYSLIDAAWCLWDPRRQTIHDKIARTVVVNVRQHQQQQSQQQQFQQR